MTDSLKGEQLRFMDGKELGSLCYAMIDGMSQRKIRRIIEKRVSQQYWCKNHDSHRRDNYSRYRIGKYTSNQIRNIYYEAKYNNDLLVA